MQLLKLIKLLVIKNMKKEKFLTFLSVIGIALGVGLFVGVKVASDQAISSFESSIKGLSPYENYEIYDIAGIDFDETIYKDVRIIEEESFPVLKTFGYIPEIKETIDIYGLYSVKALRYLNIAPEKIPYREEFYKEINGVLITRKFADTYSLRKNDIITPLVYDRQYPLKIVDILDTESVNENTLIMDIGNFQEYFKRYGYLTRIDLHTDDKSADKIQKKLPSHLKIRKKEDIFRNQKSLIASFRYNLQFISLVAILVGIFLLYNTIFISVVKRRTEIGILRGIGADRKTIIILFAVQGILLGISGSLLGILFGQLTAYFSVIAVEKTISIMYSTISISDYIITGRDVIMVLLLGLIISLTASAIPAYEASKIRPNESIREGSFEYKFRKYRKIFSLAGIGFIISGIIISYLDYIYTPFEFPVLAYLGILFIIAGFTFISPLYLSLLLSLIKRPSEKIFRATGRITLADMRGNIYRFSVALMSVAISSALIIALFTLIFSFRNSLKGWINQYITADVYIKPASCKSNYCFHPISEEVIDIVRNFPEVIGVDNFRALHIELNGKKVIAGFADIKVKRKYSAKRYFDREYDTILKEMEGEEKVAGISDYLSIKYGLKKGDFIELETPKGRQSFIINDVSSSYSTTSGFVYIDRKWLKKFWGLDDATQFSVYVKDGVDIDAFIQKLKERLSPYYAVEIWNNQGLRDKILDIFNKSFAITYAIEFISIIVSLIGVINTLLALVFEKKREISIIRYLGGKWQQIQQTLILSAAVVGITGILLGMLLGPLMSIIFMHVVNKISFGWKINFSLPYFYLLIVIVILFLTTLFAGFLPSKVARKIDPKRFISFE